MKNEEITEDRYKYYTAELSVFREHSISVSASYDNHLITVSAGVIASSIAFLGLSSEHFIHLWVIYLGWILFLSCITLLLWTQRLALKRNNECADILREWFLSGELAGPKFNDKNGTAEKLKNVEILSWISFVWGLCLFAVFLGLNLRSISL